MRNDSFVDRGRESLAVDLKHPEAVEAVLRLVEKADILVEGYRPGVAERIGLGPDVCLARNPRLVYGRMTGWGQNGPLANAVGHDINYIALSGALHPLGYADRPPSPPLNLVGDYGGGGMYLAVGLLAAHVATKSTGRGQVVDAAMTDGAALLMAPLYGMMAKGHWVDRRGAEFSRRSRAFLSRLRMRGRQVHCGRRDRAAFLQSHARAVAGLPIRTSRISGGAIAGRR